MRGDKGKATDARVAGTQTKRRHFPGRQRGVCADMFTPYKNEGRELRSVVFVETFPGGKDVEMMCRDKQSGEELPVLPLAFFEKINMGAIVRQRVTDEQLLKAMQAVTASIVSVAKGNPFAAPRDLLVTNLLDKIIMLTVFDNDENIFNAIKAGADGYLLKEVNPKDLHQGIIETMNGGATMTPSIAMKTLKLFRNPIAFENIPDQEDYNLTPREIEVLEQLSKGLKYDAIAKNLFLSAGTIRKHVENIYTKLQVHNKLEAIAKAKNNNLI